ncbi:IS200/IS605 family transposase [uncultured Draconibacterium sp.]|uniref:IS200/IS605 family transposase n=1 Tax=uncultured Draconibacterium sp. TaxID=1573823 RepID=UPI00321732AD
MANTYTQVHIQMIFSVQNRISVIRKSWEKELYQYITGIIQNYNHKVLAINGMPDHIHILIGMRPTQALSDLLQDIKGSSSKWINQKGFVNGQFSWQEGFGAFSYSRSHVDAVIEYITKQKEHHKKRTFIEEYLEFLKKFDIPFNERYIFNPVEYETE